MFANVRTFGIDPEHPTVEDLDNLDWLREVRFEKDSAVVQADKARWVAQAKQMVAKVPKSKPKRYKVKVPKTAEEEVLAGERREAREARNRHRAQRKALQSSRELVSLH